MNYYLKEYTSHTLNTSALTNKLHVLLITDSNRRHKLYFAHKLKTKEKKLKLNLWDFERVTHLLLIFAKYYIC